MGDVFAAGIAALEKELFWERVAGTSPDEDYLREFAEWDQADSGADNG
ncbi:MAG: hypothetical protein LBK28_03855 [Propionibacteriaceae bacterium]|nr:hypothetical protein [Propionibacteriaceae bacterium]